VTREPASYVGRFAPSPTGPLHFGSLVAAVASYLQARCNEGQWLLRVEDIDPPREQAGAAHAIVDTLRAYGFQWDGDVLFQSESASAHRQALERLVADGWAYPCGCSRSDLDAAPRGPLGVIYPGTCRQGCDAAETAIRVRTRNEPIGFTDGLQGPVTQSLESESGDFVVRRRDQLIAYHLAVVVDDALQGITEVVRGIDLLDSTPRQICLQRLLAYATPAYSHIPVVVHANGDKLSKLTGAAGIPPDGSGIVLVAALAALMQEPPAVLARSSLDEIWHWALEHWQPRVLRGVTAVRMDSPALRRLDINPLFA